MKMLKDSSEIREARDLLMRITAVAPPQPAAPTPPAPEIEPPAGDAALAGQAKLSPETEPHDTSTVPEIAPMAGDAGPGEPSEPSPETEPRHTSAVPVIEPLAGDAGPGEPSEPSPEAAPRDTSAAPMPAQAAPAPPAPPAAVAAAVPPPPPVWVQPEPEHAEGSFALEVESLVSAPRPPAVEEQAPAQPSAAVAQPDDVSASRDERLHAVLSALCDSEGYAGAMVTDASGFPLSASRNLEAGDSLAALSTLLGDVLAKAGSYLGRDDASQVTLDVGARQKVVLRRFYLEERALYLVVTCLRVLETHHALDRTVPQIVLTLGSS